MSHLSPRPGYSTSAEAVILTNLANLATSGAGFAIAKNSDGTFSNVAVSGGGSMSIGGTVTSGTTGSVLFVGAGPVLAQDNTNFFYTSATRLLTVDATGTTTSIHTGPAAGTSNITVGGAGVEFIGDNNTLGGVNLILGNKNSGTKAFADLFLQNDLADGTGTHYAVVGLNSSTYNDTTYGTINAIPNQLQLYGTDGPTTVGTSKSGSYLNFFIGGTSTTNEVGRFTSTGLGIATTAPTHSLTLSSASTGIAIYNTSDQVTNYERVTQSWISNAFVFSSEQGGTGTLRNIGFHTNPSFTGANLLISTVNSGSQPALTITPFSGGTASISTSSSSDRVFKIFNGNGAATLKLLLNNALGASSGVQIMQEISPTISQTSTAGYIALLINPTETTTGSGLKLLIDAQIGSVDVFTLANTGITTITTPADTASLQTLVLKGTRATPTVNDEIYQSFYLNNSVGTNKEFARITTRASTITAGSEGGDILFTNSVTGSMGTAGMVLGATTLRPGVNNGRALGTNTISWSGLFLASGGVINWANGDVTLTHSTGVLALVGAQTITSASATSFVVGPNGATNPVFEIDGSAASAATGLLITSAAAASGVTLGVISSGSNETFNITSKGSGDLNFKIGSTTRYLISGGTRHMFSTAVSTAASSIRFSFTGAADTGLTAATEAPSVYFNSAQVRQHASNTTITLQRDFRISASTHSFASATGTITDAAALAVDGAPIVSTNAAITNSSTFYSAGSAIGAAVTNSYGLNITANTGATNNYAATFQTGNVGIGDAAPAALLTISPVFTGASWGTSGRGLMTKSGIMTDTTGSGTITTRVGHSFSSMTFASSSSVTLTSAATLYISDAPAAGTNTTITNGYALFVDNGNTRFDGFNGFGTVIPASVINIGGAQSATSWTTTGLNFAVNANMITDTSTGAAGTVAIRASSSFAQPTYDATNAITVTDGATVYIANAPTVTGNVTLTNPWAIWVDNGNVRFDGNLTLTSGTIELGNVSDTTLSRSGGGVLAVEGVVIPSISSTNTLTNKRITRRTASTAGPGATPTTNSDNVDFQVFTNLATAITSMTTNLSGTPNNGDFLEFWLTDNGSPLAITWGASFAATTVALPTTTVTSTTLRVLFEWGSSVWNCVATA